MMNTYNLPPGVTLRDIDPPSAIPEGWHECPECGRLTFADLPWCFACQLVRDRDAATEEREDITKERRKETNEH